MGRLRRDVAAVDRGVAVHRGPQDGAAQRLLHPVHLQQRVDEHHHHHRRLLRPRLHHVRALRQGLVGDRQEAEGARAPPGRQEGLQQEVGLKVSAN